MYHIEPTLLPAPQGIKGAAQAAIAATYHIKPLDGMLERLVGLRREVTEGNLGSPLFVYRPLPEGYRALSDEAIDESRRKGGYGGKPSVFLCSFTALLPEGGSLKTKAACAALCFQEPPPVPSGPHLEPEVQVVAFRALQALPLGTRTPELLSRQPRSRLVQRNKA